MVPYPPGRQSPWQPLPGAPHGSSPTPPYTCTHHSVFHLTNWLPYASTPKWLHHPPELVLASHLKRGGSSFPPTEVNIAPTTCDILPLAPTSTPKLDSMLQNHIRHSQTWLQHFPKTDPGIFPLPGSANWLLYPAHSSPLICLPVPSP